MKHEQRRRQRLGFASRGGGWRFPLSLLFRHSVLLIFCKRKLIDIQNRYTYNSIRKTPKSKTPHHFLSRFSARKDTKKTPRQEKRPVPCGTDLSNQAVFKPILLESECLQPSITCRSSASAGQRTPCRDGPRRGPSHQNLRYAWFCTGAS